MKSRRFRPALCLLPLAIALASCAERDPHDAGSGTATSAPVPPAPVSSAPGPSAPVPPEPVAVEFAIGEAAGRCNIETINGVSADDRDVPVSSSADVTVEGWALPLTAAGAPPWGLYLQTVDGRLFDVGAMTSVNRPDLLALADAPVAETAGFRAEFRVPTGSVGRIGLFLAPTVGDTRPTCAVGRGIYVTP